MSAAVLLTGLTASAPAARAQMPICPDFDRARWVTCVHDGDRGWHEGREWKLVDVRAPRIDNAACRGEQLAGIKSRDRLSVLMSRGYTLIDSARREGGVPLVKVKLADGQDAAKKLLGEGLVQAKPITGNPWCPARP